MRYTPDTETPPAQPSAEVSRQKGIWGSGTTCRCPHCHFWAPVVKAQVAKAPMTKPWRLLICPVPKRKCLSSRNFSLQPPCPLLSIVHSTVTHGLKRNCKFSDVPC